MFDQACCWIDGSIVPAAEAKVSVFDHGFLYGDGVFEGVRFYNRKAFRLPLHLKRLQRSAAALQLAMPYDSGQMAQAVAETIAASPLADGYLRIIVTRGVGVLGINPATCKQPSVVIIADQLQMVSDAQRSQGVRAIIASTRRLTPDRLDSRIKSLNYLNAILARMEANYAGVEEAILLNDRGCVAEGTADNLFIVSDGVLLTPPATEGALAGITRQTVLELAEAGGIPAREAVLTPYDLYNADECFLTGTGAKLIPVREIDGRKMAACPGLRYQQLSQAFAALIEQETSAP
ncbi:branched-chain-amino-acid transaminase [Candidatus Thiothrix sp. Deng01]|uniref:Branched-chain-amino-acid aminotransferase n=1 Tax=Candidatus Thiothrix phosphatis TaxID=3112415 RepID=A0ABU6CYU9_9GAMM|nr:branched-chain-amino-acid transaminase [Candidatus Thiothrix sp. Deng01]MEB4592021.1 branched-chain-amino-acid transaminase [Candidatus Thiothrix sp. Deng01]